MRSFQRCVVVLLVLVPAALARAGGAGGIGWSRQLFDAGMSNKDLGITSFGGFGYGVGWDGVRIGGFGMAFTTGTDVFSGGVGGILTGREWRSGPFTAALTFWAGLGGGAWNGQGYFLGYGSLQAELGLWVVPWMQISAFVGYEVLGNIAPGPAFSEALLRTPVVGMRLAWGGR